MADFDSPQPSSADDAVTAAPASQESALRFTGSGAEYFRIWAVNLSLTVLSLGLYSPWAKVRRLQYFYRNTELDGAAFDYVAKPSAILLGRLLAVVLVALNYFALQYSATAVAVYTILLVVVLPYLLWQSNLFRARNTRYRGLSFGFDGGLHAAYRVYVPPLLLSFSPSIVTAFVLGPKVGPWVLILTSLGLLALPFFHALFRRYMQLNLRFGDTRFGFFARTGDFVLIWVFGLMILVGAGIFGAILVGVIAAAVAGNAFRTGQASVTLAVAAAMAFSVLLCYLFIGSYFSARFQKLVWERTCVGSVGCRCDISARRLLWLQFRNTLWMILSLGLYRPFAAIRLARYRLQSMTVTGVQHLGSFKVGASQSRRGATGESAAEFFEMDVGL
jgi:uncharacterized membrane protein YjgN (DUF898 family)